MKRVVIMGASSGIGLHVAEALVSRGVKVGLAARHTEVFREMKNKYGDLLEYESIDVTKPSAVTKLHELIEKLGGMDIYFHSTGIGYSNLTLEPEAEVRVIRTNAEGFARMMCCAYRYFRDMNRKGQICAITSVAGTNGIGRLTAYSSTKKFCQTYLVALEQLANNEGADITFTDIRPGWVRTPLLEPGAKYPMEMDVEYVVPQVIRAIVRKKRVAVIDCRWNLVVGLWRLIPNFLWIRMNLPLSEPEQALPSPITQKIEDAFEEQGAQPPLGGGDDVPA